MKQLRQVVKLPLIILVSFALGWSSYAFVSSATRQVAEQQVQSVSAANNVDIYADLTADGMVQKTNEYRATKGLGPLVENPLLMGSAQMKANDMQAKNYWGHVSPDGLQPWDWFDRVGYVYKTAGENLAYGFATSKGVVDGWIKSPEHERNLSGNYNEVGIAILKHVDYQGKTDQAIVVAHYGLR